MRITYNQREDSQPANFNFFNVSQKWTLNWLAYVQDDPTTPGATVTRYLSGGGAFYYTGYNSGTGAFAAQYTDDSVLTLISQTPIVYRRQFRDGGIEEYAETDGSTSYPRNVFLTKVIDPQGNTLTLNYDSQKRLASLADTTGRQTTFSYATSTSLLITQITDPFGRSATLGYDSQGRLNSITDVLGLTSTFGYDSNSLVNSMTTPYGTTTFSYTAPGTIAPPRYVQVTDPLLFSEREEWLSDGPPAPSYPPDMDDGSAFPDGLPLQTRNQYLEYRNSFHWDKQAYVSAGCKLTGGCDYTMARIKHFHHASNIAYKATSIESIKYPPENRIWYNYPGQAGDYTYIAGNYDRPTAAARAVSTGDPKTTQLN